MACTKSAHEPTEPPRRTASPPAVAISSQNCASASGDAPGRPPTSATSRWWARDRHDHRGPPRRDRPRPRPRRRARPGAARARPRAAARVLAQLRHGVRTPRAVHLGDVRAVGRGAAGGAERLRRRRRVPPAPGRHRAEAGPAADLRAGLLGRGRAPGSRARARPAGRRRVLRLEPLRSRTAHHRPVGAAARLRRPALGTAGRAQARRRQQGRRQGAATSAAARPGWPWRCCPPSSAASPPWPSPRSSPYP